MFSTVAEAASSEQNRLLRALVPPAAYSASAFGSIDQEHIHGSSAWIQRIVDVDPHLAALPPLFVEVVPTMIFF